MCTHHKQSPTTGRLNKSMRDDDMTAAQYMENVKLGTWLSSHELHSFNCVKQALSAFKDSSAKHIITLKLQLTSGACFATPQSGNITAINVIMHRNFTTAVVRASHRCLARKERCLKSSNEQARQAAKSTSCAHEHVSAWHEHKLNHVTQAPLSVKLLVFSRKPLIYRGI